MHKSTNTHGGARKGAGRKPALDVATIRKTIRLTPHEWTFLQSLAASPSQAIRRLIQDRQEQSK